MGTGVNSDLKKIARTLEAKLLESRLQQRRRRLDMVRPGCIQRVHRRNSGVAASSGGVMATRSARMDTCRLRLRQPSRARELGTPARRARRRARSDQGCELRLGRELPRSGWHRARVLCPTRLICGSVLVLRLPRNWSGERGTVGRGGAGNAHCPSAGRLEWPWTAISALLELDGAGRRPTVAAAQGPVNSRLNATCVKSLQTTGSHRYSLC